MQAGVSVAENAIRKNITDRTLTQQQFDALVSFTYNVGAGGAREVLRLVDLGWFNQAAQTMMLYVHAAVYGKNRKQLRDKRGQIIMRVLPALVTRRQEESAPFRESK